jgi:hypothetical protein
VVGFLAESVFNWREAAPQAPSGDYKHGRGNPNPEDLAPEHVNPAIREESPETDRRYADGGPKKKVAVIVEWGEEGDSQTAVRHGIEETMGGGRQKEIDPQAEPAKRREASPEPQEHHGARQERSKKKGVRESAVAPEVAVTDAKSESNHIEIGNHGAGGARHPDPVWGARPVETGSDAKSCNRVREY